MNENVKNLAQQAGFTICTNKQSNSGDVINWSDCCDQHFVRYTQLLVQEVLELQTAGTDVLTYFGIAETDSKESIEVDFNDKDLLQYMKMAHERNITFNKFIEVLLCKAIQEYDLATPNNTDIEGC